MFKTIRPIEQCNGCDCHSEDCICPTTGKQMTKTYSPEDFKSDNHAAKVKAEAAKLRAQKEFQAKVEKLLEEFNTEAQRIAEDPFHAHLGSFSVVTDTKELADELVTRLRSVGWEVTEPKLFDELSMSHCKHQFWVTKP